MGKVFRDKKAFRFIVFLIMMSLLSCISSDNYKKYYSNKPGQAFGPRNGVEKGSVMFSCDVRDYGLKHNNVKNVYIISYYNKYSYVNGRNDEILRKYQVKFIGVDDFYVFPLKMNKISKNLYKKKLIFPDGHFSYYFNITLNTINSNGLLFFVKRDKNNVAMELVDGFGRDSVIIIKNGKLDRIYDKKIIKDKRLKRVIPKIVFPYPKMPIEERKRL